MQTPAPAEVKEEVLEEDVPFDVKLAIGLAALREAQQAEFESAKSVVTKLLANVVANPEDPKYRRIRVGNSKIAAMLATKGILAILISVGFVEDGEFLTLPATEPTVAAQQAVDRLAALTRRKSVEDGLRSEPSGAARQDCNQWPTFELPHTFPATGGKPLCRVSAVEPERWFGPFQEKTLACNAAARDAIDRVCWMGGFTQSWSSQSDEGGFVSMTKLPVIVLVHIMLGLPAGCDDQVRSLIGAYSICMDARRRTCMNVIAGRRPHPNGSGFVLDKFSLYYPDNNAVPAAWGRTWSLLHGYSFRTAVLNGTLNRAALSDLRRGTIPLARGTSFDRREFGLVVDNESAYEDCAYVQGIADESDAERALRIERMVIAMSAAYGRGTLALSYDPAESQRGVTALQSEWELLKSHLRSTG